MNILILIGYFIFINLIGYFIMWYDKKMAIKKNSRIAEKTIFTICLFLGSIGVYAGIYKFRHKTKHIKFTVLVPILFILNIFSIYYIIQYIIPYLETICI